MIQLDLFGGPPRDEGPLASRLEPEVAPEAAPGLHDPDQMDLFEPRAARFRAARAAAGREDLEGARAILAEPASCGDPEARRDLAAARASLTAALARARRARTMYALGDLATLEGNPAAARDCYCEALARDPFDEEAVSAIRDRAILELPDIARYRRARGRGGRDGATVRASRPDPGPAGDEAPAARPVRGVPRAQIGRARAALSLRDGAHGAHALGGGCRRGGRRWRTAGAAGSR